MDEIIKIGEKKYINSVNNDINVSLKLDSVQKQLTEFDVSNVLSLTQQFDNERQKSNKYQIYGSFEYLSLLNGLKINYKKIEDLFVYFNDDISLSFSNKKNLLSSFNIYLVKPASEFLFYSNDRIQRKYEVISNLSDVDIINAGYSRNIYNEEKHNIIINNKINLTDIRDGLDLPITELFLYCEYKPYKNGYDDDEILSGITYNISGYENGYETLSPVELNVGDILNGDIITFDLKNFKINEEISYNNKISTTFMDDGSNKFNLIWEYNPFIKITVDYFSDDISIGSVSGTTYDDLNLIPNYSKKITYNNTTYIWRDMVDKGFVDPLSNIGIISPFLNDKHYIYNNFILNVTPDLTDETTKNIFEELKFGDGSNLGATPTDNLNDFGKPCK